mgnify:CR=1 FL=1
MSRIERYNFILPETSIAHCIRCFIVDCSLYFSTICYVILSKIICNQLPALRAHQRGQGILASRLRVQKYNKLHYNPNRIKKKFEKKSMRTDFSIPICQKWHLRGFFGLSPLLLYFSLFLLPFSGLEAREGIGSAFTLRPLYRYPTPRARGVIKRGFAFNHRNWKTKKQKRPER